MHPPPPWFMCSLTSCGVPYFTFKHLNSTLWQNIWQRWGENKNFGNDAQIIYLENGSRTTPHSIDINHNYYPPEQRSLGQLPTRTTPHQDHYKPVKPLKPLIRINTCTVGNSSGKLSGYGYRSKCTTHHHVHYDLLSFWFPQPDRTLPEYFTVYHYNGLRRSNASGKVRINVEIFESDIHPNQRQILDFQIEAAQKILCTRATHIPSACPLRLGSMARLTLCLPSTNPLCATLFSDTLELGRHLKVLHVCSTRCIFLPVNRMENSKKPN